MSNLDGTVTKIDESLASSSTAKRTNALHHLLSELVVSSKASTLLSARLNQTLAAATTPLDNGHAAKLAELEARLATLDQNVADLRNSYEGGAAGPPSPAPSTSTKQLSEGQLTCLRALNAFEDIYLDSQPKKRNSVDELARMKKPENQLVASATELMANSSAKDQWGQLLKEDLQPHVEPNRTLKLRLIHALREAVLSDAFPTTM